MTRFLGGRRRLKAESWRRAGVGRSLGASAMAVALLAGCSSGNGEPPAPEPTAAAEVCGGFAREPETTAALKSVTGADQFDEGLSIPEKALAGLRDGIRVGQEDPTRPQGYAYCWLLNDPAPSGERYFKVDVRGVSGAPGRDARLAYKTTWYSSGVQALAGGGQGTVYFTCQVKPPAKGIIIETVALVADGVDNASLRRRTQLITLANAAARQISKELGCVDDKLAPGVPSPVKV
ncbi:hypothetical protein ACFYU9_06370 [Streptomyces sp. NPDC004327]|uniref:hypothetical protein n=1 Tax=Streptomyces sp. NPDC004327 TaxID=3364699 RepID=UPI003673EA7A